MQRTSAKVIMVAALIAGIVGSIVTAAFFASMDKGVASAPPAPTQANYIMVANEGGGAWIVNEKGEVFWVFGGKVQMKAGSVK